MRFIDGTRVKEFFTCSRLPYLSFHRDRADELPPTARSAVYFEAGNRIEREILEGIEHEAIRFRPGDWNEGFLATQDAMARRVPAIAHGVLKLGEFLGRPDLLLYDDALGGYEVADIKSTMTTKTSARMQIAFYSRLLGQIAVPPRFGHVIRRDGSRESFEIAALEASLHRVLEILQRQRGARAADPGALWREHCLDCRYREICRGDLETSDAIERLPGLTRAQAAALRAAGYATLGALAARTPDSAAKDPAGSPAIESELPADQVQALADRARAASEGRAIALRPPRQELRDATFALAAVRSERLVDPEVAIAGCVFSDTERYKLRLLRPADDPNARANLASLLSNLARSTGPIVVFGDSVRKVLDAAIARHDLDFSLAALTERFCDLKLELRRGFALPSFDGSPALAAACFGIERGDDAVDVAALAFLEGAAGADVSAIDALLRRDLLLIAAIRSRMLEGTAA